jgi:hypothetical protein
VPTHLQQQLASYTIMVAEGRRRRPSSHHQQPNTDLGATPSPSLWCFVSTSSFGDGVTSSMSSLNDKARGNGHPDDGMPTRHQPSSPTSRHSPYYEGTSSLGSRHHHSSTTTTGATLCLRASTSVGCTFIIPQPAFRCSTGHKWTCYRGTFRYLVHMPTPGWILGAV